MEVKPLRQGSAQAGYKQTVVGVIPDSTLADRGRTSQENGSVGLTRRRGERGGKAMDKYFPTILLRDSASPRETLHRGVV